MDMAAESNLSLISRCQAEMSLWRLKQQVKQTYGTSKSFRNMQIWTREVTLGMQYYIKNKIVVKFFKSL